MSTPLPTPIWPRMPAGFEFPRSSKLPPGEREAHRTIIQEATARETFTRDQSCLLLGTLLGDGAIAPQGYFVINHSRKQAEYLWTKYIGLSEFVPGRPSSAKRTKQSYESVRFWTATTPAFRFLRARCYPDGVKRLTQEWLDAIDRVGFLQTMAWVIGDDGTRSGPLYSPTLMICTNGFEHDEVDIFCRWLTDHGYQSSIYTRFMDGYRPYPMVLFTTEASVRLMRDLLPWTPPCMHYKLIVEGREDTATCMFCGEEFYRPTLLRRTDLPSYPCCGAAGCVSARDKIYYQVARRDPNRNAIKDAKKREHYARDEEFRERCRAQMREHVKTHPEQYRAAKRRYRTRQRAIKDEILWTCPLCKKQEPITAGRNDRQTCGECKPEALRLRAKIKAYKKSLASLAITPERTERLTAMLTAAQRSLGIG